VYLNEDRLYTERGNNLYVYSFSDLSCPIATYPLGSGCRSCIIYDNRLYLGEDKKLHIFEVNLSNSQPLMLVTVIETASSVVKIFRVGHELLLGEYDGYF